MHGHGAGRIHAALAGENLAGDIGGLEADAFSNDGARASVDNPADNGSDSFAQPLLSSAVMAAQSRACTGSETPLQPSIPLTASTMRASSGLL